MPFVQESSLELINLERRNPLMANRLRFLRLVQANQTGDVSPLLDQFGIPKFEMERWIEMYRLGGLQLLLNPRTLLDDTPRMDKTLSQHAEEELLRLYNNHPRQLGSAVMADLQSCKQTGKPSGATDVESCSVYQPYVNFELQIKDWKVTDCFTYIKSVLRYTYEKLGQPKTFKKLNAADRGTVLAQLLNGLGWKSYLCMRDTENPYDKLDKHTKKYKEALKTNKWWGVNLSGFIVNYLPNQNPPAGRRVTALDADGKRRYDALTNIGFGVCTFTEGLHTGLFSRGEIYEVHWASLSEQSTFGDPKYAPLYDSNLYEKTVMSDFGWEEILLTIPPDSKVSLI